MRDYEKMLLVVDIFKALGDPVRMKLIRVLGTQFENSASVGDLVKMFKISQPAISQHLKILKNMNLVTAKKDSYFVYYSVNTEKIKEYKKLMDEVFVLGITKCDKFPDCEECTENANCEIKK